MTLDEYSPLKNSDELLLQDEVTVELEPISKQSGEKILQIITLFRIIISIMLHGYCTAKCKVCKVQLLTVSVNEDRVPAATQSLGRSVSRCLT